jgi:hypothetical protein
LVHSESGKAGISSHRSVIGKQYDDEFQTHNFSSVVSERLVLSDKRDCANVCAVASKGPEAARRPASSNDYSSSERSQDVSPAAAF